GHRAGFAAPAEDEDAGGGEGEEDEVDGDDVVDDELEGAEQRDGRGEGGLQHDGGDGDAGFFVDFRDRREEDAVLGHLEVDARRGEDRLAQETERGDGDAGGDQGGAFFAEGGFGDVHRGGGARGEVFQAEHSGAGQRHARIEEDDAEHAGDERARQIAARVFQFAGDEAGRLPAAVGEEDRDQGGADRALVSGGDGSAGVSEEETAADQRGEHGDLGHHQRALDAAARGHAQAVDHGEQRHREGGDEALVEADAGQLREV